MVNDLCTRWSCPPSVILAEDAIYIGRMLQLIELGKPEEDGS